MPLPSPRRLSPCVLVWALAFAPAQATVSIYVSEQQLVESSALILEATVRESASGQDPESGAVATYVTLDVDRVRRGPLELERVVLREPGGSLADRTLDVDAVPRYEPGERVLVYLEPGPDGALRTAQHFFGKYRIVPDGSGRDAYQVRDLDGHGRILARPAVEQEWRPLRDAPAPAQARSPRSLRPWLAAPPELDRVLWLEPPATAAATGQRTLAVAGAPATPPTLDARGRTIDALFLPLQAATPARWIQSDAGAPVYVHVEPANDPLGNPALALAQIQSALHAWTAVSEARITLLPGDLDYDYTGTRSGSPGSVYSGVNIVLFDDPYGEISDPIDCAGVLAMGGYWRSAVPTSTVNGQTFYSALQLHVTFNNEFECFLGDPENLAEIAAHEIGHGLGFGHSSAPDAIMRSSAYGGRGARLGDDDRDAAHCHYPHGFTIVSPAAGEVYFSGTERSISWTATAESGPEPGTVDLEYSTDGGESWLSLAQDVPNSGTRLVHVPDAPSTTARVRLVRPPRGADVPASYPEACSQAVSASFTIAAPAGPPGAVPDGTSGEPLRVARSAGGPIQITWGAAVSGTVSDYAIYSGTLASLASGAWDAAPATCSAGLDRVELLVAPGNRYFLVSALSGPYEGSLGQSSSGAEHPAPQPMCGTLAGGGSGGAILEITPKALPLHKSRGPFVPLAR